MASAVVEVDKVSKYFRSERPLHQILAALFTDGRRLCALHEVTFTVAPGQILGIVGPNGAGKTTLLRILTGLLEADEGIVGFCGHDLSSLGPRARRDIGYVSNDERSFFWRLTGVQNLVFFGCLYGLSRAQAQARTCDLLEGLAVEGQARRLFRDYSSGTRKKFALARALLHHPRLVLLDEVTNSLDPPSARTVKSQVRDYVSSDCGRAGIWSTHRLEEIGEICDKVLILNHGRVEFFGSADEHEFRQRRFPASTFPTRSGAAGMMPDGGSDRHTESPQGGPARVGAGRVPKRDAWRSAGLPDAFVRVWGSGSPPPACPALEGGHGGPPLRSET